MGTGTDKPPIYTFGPYRLDPSERLLSRDGTALSLTPKAFDLLVYLVERHGRLVEKTTLMSALWPDTVVEEANVAYNISALRKALGDDRGDARFIETVPTRGYRFVAPVVEAPLASHLPDFRGRRLGFVVARLTAPLVATVVVGSAAAAWLLLRSPGRPDAPPMRLVPLTTLTGLEDHPTFSPDGEQVAFAWNGAKQDNWDIYVTLIGSSEVRRLTSDPAPDTHPAWSPDGRQIAYLRERPAGTTIQLVSALSGADRRLSDFPDADSIGWARDGHWVVVGRLGGQSLPGPSRGIYLIPVEGGDPQPLIASAPDVADFQPAFSPDGGQLAFVSCSHAPATGVPVWTGCEIHLVDVDGARVTSASRRLTSQIPFISSVSWTRDGSAVIYAGEDQWASGVDTLWRVGTDGTHAPERIELAGIDAFAPATALSRDRLAFTRTAGDTDIYRLEVGRPVQLLAGSTFEEIEPRLSRDGRRLVFASRRSGDTIDIWMADADGSGVQRLTRGPSRIQGSPYWSPDGRRVVFDSFGDDYHWHIWTVDAEGGTPRRLTTQTGNENAPTWSHDGRYIYFSADPGSGRDIWRVLASGGIPERLTHGVGGFFACESVDGGSLLFQPEDADTPLMAMALTGGEVRQLAPCARNTAFGAGPQGIYYVPCDPSPDPSVHVLDLKTGRDQRLGTLDGLRERPMGLSVSPDGNTIVYPRQVLTRADLMLIENFK